MGKVHFYVSIAGFILLSLANASAGSLDSYRVPGAQRCAVVNCGGGGGGGGGGQAPVQSEDQILNEQGNQAFSKGDYVEAERLYRLAFQANQYDSVILSNLAGAITEQGTLAYNDDK